MLCMKMILSDDKKWWVYEIMIAGKILVTSAQIGEICHLLIQSLFARGLQLCRQLFNVVCILSLFCHCRAV